MATVSDVLRTAATEIGYSRWTDPEAGTKYGRWYAGKVGDSYFAESGVPYCAMFVSYILAQCGIDFLYSYCPYILRDYRAQVVSTRLAQPGDVVLFDWGGDGVPDHVGFVEQNCGTYLQTIEGNTSSGSGGSQGNGGGVYRRTRSFGVVRAVIRLNLSSSTVPIPVQTDESLGDTTWWGPAFTRELQRQRGTIVDGVISSQPIANRSYLGRADTASWRFVRNAEGSQVMGSLQALTGADMDGFFGHQSVMALQRWLVSHGCDVGASGIDGFMGADTCVAIGSALKAGAFRG